MSRTTKHENESKKPVSANPTGKVRRVTKIDKKSISDTHKSPLSTTQIRPNTASSTQGGKQALKASKTFIGSSKQTSKPSNTPKHQRLLDPVKRPYSSYLNPLKSTPELDNLYATKTLTILSTLFPKSCNCPKPNLLFFKVKNRPTVARCSNCHKQVSITSGTPLEDFKLPLSYFSYILEDQILQYPKVVTSREISKKLNIPYKSAYYLKRRLQILFSLLNEKLQKQMFQELTEHNEKNPIKLAKSGDLREVIKDEPVAVADSVVLYSSSLRANKHRSRRYKTGTSSIYLSNSLGGEQKGVLVHTVGINHGMTFYKSIPLNNQNYLGKDLDEKIPKNTILFTDEGYTFIWDRKNHRMVNHSKRSGDHRYNMSRERWVTKEGVSSNGAEARNNLLKQSFRSYSYISPKWSQLYLDEISFLGNVRFAEGLKGLLLGEGRDRGLVRESDTNCGRRDLNPHASRRQNLNLVRLPISPRPQCFV